QENQVARDLRKLDRYTSQRGRIRQKSLLVPGCSEQIGGRNDWLACQLGEMCRTFFAISLGRIKSCADCGRTHIDRVQIFLRVPQQLDLAFERSRKTHRIPGQLSWAQHPA